MSTSAEPALRIEVRRYDHPDAAALVAALQAEYRVRYGGPDETPVDSAEFGPPTGLFLVGYRGADVVACGGWRTAGPGEVEIKRMYVKPGERRRGVARLILDELERRAAEAGFRDVRLETGTRQPEATAMYSRAGYRPVAAFGTYRDAEGSIHLGKKLTGS